MSLDFERFMSHDLSVTWFQWHESCDMTYIWFHTGWNCSNCVRKLRISSIFFYQCNKIFCWIHHLEYHIIISRFCISRRKLNFWWRAKICHQTLTWSTLPFWATKELIFISSTVKFADSGTDFFGSISCDVPSQVTLQKGF